MNRITLTEENFYSELKKRFMDLLTNENIMEENVSLKTKALSPEEAIGITKRKDFPIITGKDVMIQAECMGALGQAFTDAPVVFHGNLKEICSLDLNDSHSRGIFIASLNAVMKALGKVECTVHCRNDGPELCAADVTAYLKEHYGNPRIALIGYQPALLEHLASAFSVRITDMNPDNVGQTRFGVLIESAEKNREITHTWADLILVTGSTVCNGTITQFLDQLDRTLFYGTSLAGAAPLLGLPRICFADRYQ